MWYAKWNNKKYKMLDSAEIEKSSREVTYTDLKLDFSECTMEDLPYAQQEVKIVDRRNNLKFTGFVAEYQLPELTRRKGVNKELSLSLFSPRQMTTKRTITIVRTDTLENIIQQVLQVLYEDGFALEELNIPETVITIKLISRTIEETLNYLSNKYSLYWNIDENKKITINSIDYQFSKPAKKSINIENYKDEIKGLISISPVVENIDYANIINVKNARIFYTDTKDLNISLAENDRYDFENPIDISLATAERIQKASIKNGSATAVTNISITYNTNKEASIVCYFNVSEDIGNGRKMIDIATDDSDGALFSLTMDSTFKNLATGITYKGTNSITINNIYTETALRYANMKLINWQEINKYVGKITPSGQIEKILDVEQGWFTVEELIEYIRNTFTINNKETNQINILYDKENDIVVGDRIDIDLPDYFTQGNFIVTGIQENKEGNNPTQYNIELRNTNLTENFIDLFRSSTDIEEQEEQTEMEYVVEYAEEETIYETHEIEVDTVEN